MTDQLTLYRLFERGRILGRGKFVKCFTSDHQLEEMPHEEFTDGIVQLSQALTRSGLKPGQKVATLASNHIVHLQMMWAVPLAGGVFHAVNPRLSPDEISYIVGHADDCLLILDSEHIHAAEEILNKLDNPPQCLVFDGEHAGGFAPLESLIQSGDGPALHIVPVIDDEQAPAVLCYTSGTTGKPKGVIYSHRSISLHVFTESMVDGYGIRQSDHVLLIVPFCHGAAWGVPYSALMCGSDISILEGPIRSERILDILAKQNVTFTAAVPEVFSRISDTLRATSRPWPDFTGLRFLMGGSAPTTLTLETLRATGAHCMHCWGMTETLSAATLQHLPADSSPLEIHQGHALPITELKLSSSEDGTQELLVRGPCVADEYLGQKESVREDGWFPTGDIADIDDNGILRIQDRKKDLIKSGGEWISPAALEKALETFPAISACAVVGVESEQWGERPICFYCPHEQTSPDQIHEFLSRTACFAKWQLPDDYIAVDHLPISKNGKLDRKQLVRLYGEILSARNIWPDNV